MPGRGSVKAVVILVLFCAGSADETLAACNTTTDCENSSDCFCNNGDASCTAQDSNCHCVRTVSEGVPGDCICKSSLSFITGACCFPSSNECAYRVLEEDCAEVGGSFTEGLTRGGGNCVPTVSEWSLIVMTLLGSAAGTIMFARRRRAAAA